MTHCCSDITYHLVYTCTEYLLYGLHAWPLNKRDINSLDFVVSQFFMKLFCTNDISIVHECQMFNFKRPSEQLARRRDNFMNNLHSVCDV